MDLFWSKTKNWALHNFNNSLIWNHYMVQWAIKNSISIHSSLSYRHIGEKVLIFLVIPFDFFHNDLICISWMNKNVEICRHSPALLIKNADKRMLKGFSNLMAGRAYDPLEILVIFSVRENMSLTNNSKLILGVNDLLHVSLHHLSKGGVFVIAKRRLYSI